MWEKTTLRVFDLTMFGQLAIYRNDEKRKKAKTKIEADSLKFLFFVGTLPTPDFFADILDLEKVNGLENMTDQKFYC